MSTIAYRPRGGQEGISVTNGEMVDFAGRMGAVYVDMYIPLPNLSMAEQEKIIGECDNHEDTIYWETENGSHGWCCSKCGTVIQWG